MANDSNSITEELLLSWSAEKQGEDFIFRRRSTVYYTISSVD